MAADTAAAPATTAAPAASAAPTAPAVKARYVLLDALRGVAALCVIVYHFFEAWATSPVDQHFNHGYLAVDFFFILSGFVMSFTMSLDDFIITQLNKGTTGIETLSTYLYQDGAKRGLEPFWFAVFSIIFVVILLIVLSVNLYKNAQSKTKVGIAQ